MGVTTCLMHVPHRTHGRGEGVEGQGKEVLGGGRTDGGGEGAGPKVTSDVVGGERRAGCRDGVTSAKGASGERRSE